MTLIGRERHPTPKIVDGRLDVMITREALFAALRTDEKLFTRETLADAIHDAFCGPRFRSFDGLAGEIHRRQHLELADLIMSKAAAPKG